MVVESREEVLENVSNDLPVKMTEFLCSSIAYSLYQLQLQHIPFASTEK
jgi:hypothetical protein